MFLSSLLLLIAQLRGVGDNARYLLAAMGGIILAIGWFGANALRDVVPIAWLAAHSRRPRLRFCCSARPDHAFTR